jgi:hypothetical protein
MFLDFNKHLIKSEEIFDDISKVIEKPIMLFKMDHENIQLYYLRAVGWNKTMLLGVRKIDAQFEVVNYEMDPSIERINELHVKGQRLI